MIQPLPENGQVNATAAEPGERMTYEAEWFFFPSVHYNLNDLEGEWEHQHRPEEFPRSSRDEPFVSPCKLPIPQRGETFKLTTLYTP